MKVRKYWNVVAFDIAAHVDGDAAVVVGVDIAIEIAAAAAVIPVVAFDIAAFVGVIATVAFDIAVVVAYSIAAWVAVFVAFDIAAFAAGVATVAIVPCCCCLWTVSNT